MDPFIGEIKLMAVDYAPKGWALCNGQSLPVATNPALYSLIGNFYGGNTTSFNLPDLRGRVPVHKGALTSGAKGGSETVALATAQVPQHTHQVGVCTSAANKSFALGFHIAAPVTTSEPVQNLNLYAAAGTAGNQVALSQVSPATTPPTVPPSIPTVSSAGGGTAAAGAPHNNMQPYLTLNYCIATVGIYPSRN